MKISDEQLYGGEYPSWWYGLAYKDRVTYYSYWYPIPFNWVVHWVRAIYQRLRRPRTTTIDREVAHHREQFKREAREAGYKMGLEDGHKKGYAEGVDKTVAEIQGRFERFLDSDKTVEEFLADEAENPGAGIPE